MPTCGNGHEVPAGAKFCPECGAAVDPPPPVEPTPQPAARQARSTQPVKGKKPWAFLVGLLVLVPIIGVSGAALLATGEDAATNGSAPSATGYRQLFKPGQTTIKAARPACSKYRRVMNNWSGQARRYMAASAGKDANESVATRYAASADWLDRTFESTFEKAIWDISEQRLRATTTGAAEERHFVFAFNRDALYACGLTGMYARTEEALQRLTRHAIAIKILATARARARARANAFYDWDGNVSYRWVNRPRCDYLSCWQIRVKSEAGCPGGLYAEINIKRGNIVLDYSNDSLGSLGAGEEALLTFHVSEGSGRTAELTEINCY